MDCCRIPLTIASRELNALPNDRSSYVKFFDLLANKWMRWILAREQPERILTAPINSEVRLGLAENDFANVLSTIGLGRVDTSQTPTSTP